MTRAVIYAPTWLAVAAHHLSGINQETFADPLMVSLVVMAVADQVEQAALRDAPRRLRIVNEGNLPPAQLKFGIGTVQRYLGETGGHLLLKSPVTVVVSFNHVDGSVKGLCHLRNDEGGYQVAAVQHDVAARRRDGSKRLLKIPDVIVAIGKNRNFHANAPISGLSANSFFEIPVVYPTRIVSATKRGCDILPS